MLIVDRTQQLIMVILVACSGWLLGLGQQNLNVSALAISAAILSFVLNDWLQWVRLNRWVANVVAILVTVFALRGFFNTDSPQQLLMIANLLIYLQIVLLFQVKTPRVYWQILVLSLLQIVVAAAFNIRLEGGLIFLCYLLASAIAMVVLQIHSQTYRIRMSNRRAAATLRDVGSENTARDRIPLIVAMHDQVFPNRRPLKSMVRHVLALGIVSIAFASVTFYLVPREEIVWTGSVSTNDVQPGFSRTIDLEENVQIYLSSEIVFRAAFFDSNMNTRIELPDLPYFRGAPLPDLFIVNDQTRWRMADLSEYPGSRAILPWIWTRDFVVQSISLQPTVDPLLHTVFPAMRLESTPAEMEWNHMVSLLSILTEFRADNTGSFNYDLAIPVGENLEPLIAFPHGSFHPGGGLRLDNAPRDFARYTFMDRTRYPGLIRIAEEQAATVRERRDPVAIAYALTDYLAFSGGFDYTLDFRNFNWDNDLDRVEDFVVNQRRGHCEFFASALVLMLRSQSIPARLVVGYHGGEFDREENLYVVRKRHAHAWVEAYISPEFCPEAWFTNGQAGRGGAWLRLDPTPPTAFDMVRPTTPLVAVQDFWNTYVMGLNSAKQRNSQFQMFFRNPFRQFSVFFTISYWQRQWVLFTTRGQWHQSSILYVILVAGAIGSLMFIQARVRKRKRANDPTLVSRRPRYIKRILGMALALVAPRLSRWVAGDDPKTREVAFYQRMKRILERNGVLQAPSQTAREFGLAASLHFAPNPASARIKELIDSIVDRFYWARFSQRTLSATQLRQVDTSLDQLENCLRPPVPAQD